MFDQLSDRLQATLSEVRSRGKLSEADVDAAMREIRLALLEADVNFKVVKSFTATLKERCLGAEVLESLNPGQQVVKIVNEELTALMGGTGRELAFAATGPTVILMAGLQGSGKTTACAKLAVHLDRAGKDVALAACDVYRPAAVDQLLTVGEEADAHVYEQGTDRDPVEIAAWALDRAREESRDVLIVDTAGRLHVDEELMAELSRIRKRTKPHDVLLVVDAMTGQDAVGVAESFAEAAEFDGVVMTKLDGDARGGAALSVKAVTGKPIMFASTGEKLQDFDRFHPDRMASRILGMGDVLSLIEKAERDVDERKVEGPEKETRRRPFHPRGLPPADAAGAEDGAAQQPDRDDAGDGSDEAAEGGGGGGRRGGVGPGRGDHPLDDAGRARQPRDDQRFPAQADSRRLRNQGPARQPAGKAVRPDAQADAADGLRQDAQRPRPGPNERGRAPAKGPQALICPIPMAVRIRLRRVGSKKNPIWRIVVADKRSPRDGRTIETIGRYNPQTEPSTIELDEERARHWLEHGAQPSETVAGLLRAKGIAASGS